MDSDSSNAGESFGRRVLSILDTYTEAISGEEQDNSFISWSGISRKTEECVDLILDIHRSRKPGVLFFVVKRKANGYLLVWDFPGEQRKARIKLNLGYQVKLNIYDSTGVQVGARS